MASNSTSSPSARFERFVDLLAENVTENQVVADCGGPWLADESERREYLEDNGIGVISFACQDHYFTCVRSAELMKLDEADLAEALQLVSWIVRVAHCTCSSACSLARNATDESINFSKMQTMRWKG